MNIKIAEAFVEIKGDKSKFSKTISGAKRETTSFAKSATISLKKVSLGLGIVAAAATAVAVAIGVKLTKAIIRAGAESVKTAVKYDRLERGLTAVVGSSEEAQIQLERLAKVAELPGLSFQGAIQGSINLQAAGIEAKLAERALSAFGNALVTVGKGADDLAGVNLALTQIANKTSGFGQDVRQLQERLPQMQTALKNAFDGKPLEDLEITGKELVEALVVEFEKLEKASGGPANAIENLSIAFDRLKAETGKLFLSITSDTTKSLADIIDNIRKIIPHWKLYQDQVAVVFKNVSIIAVRSTGQMLKSIGKLVVFAGPLIWKPLFFGFQAMWTDVEDATLRGGTALLEKMRVISKDTAKAWREGIAKDSAKINAEISKSFDESFGKSIDGLVKTAEEEIPKFSKALLGGLEAINTELKTLATTVEQIEQVKVVRIKFETLITGTSLEDIATGAGQAAEPVLDLASAFGTLGAVIEFNKKGIQEFGRVAGIHLGNVGVKIGEAREVAVALGDSIRESQEKARDAFADATSGMRSVFADFISESINDINNISDAWGTFIDGMKRAFIRAMAEMVANKAFKAIIDAFAKMNQPQSAGGAPDVSQAIKQGIGTAIGAFLGNLILPGVGTVVGAAIGGTIGASISPPTAISEPEGTSTAPSAAPANTGGAGRVAMAPSRSLQVGTINIHDQDLRNFDTQRMTKQVEQGIVPALAEAAADGI